MEKAAFSSLVYKLNFSVFTHRGGIVFPEKSREELLQFVIDTLYAELVQVKTELDEREEKVGDRQRQRLRLTLRLLSKSLAEILALEPEQVTKDGILIIISRVTEAAPRRYRQALIAARDQINVNNRT